jgi:hypothetical protein
MLEAVAIARDARLLRPAAGGFALDAIEVARTETVVVPVGEALRLLVLAQGPDGALRGSANGQPLGEDHGVGAVHVVELPPSASARVILDLQEPTGLLGAWVVPRSADVPPPRPEPFDAGRPEPLN